MSKRLIGRPSELNQAGGRCEVRYHHVTAASDHDSLFFCRLLLFLLIRRGPRGRIMERFFSNQRVSFACQCRLSIVSEALGSSGPVNSAGRDQSTASAPSFRRLSKVTDRLLHGLSWLALSSFAAVCSGFLYALPCQLAVHCVN